MSSRKIPQRKAVSRALRVERALELIEEGKQHPDIVLLLRREFNVTGQTANAYIKDAHSQIFRDKLGLDIHNADSIRTFLMKDILHDLEEVMQREADFKAVFDDNGEKPTHEELEPFDASKSKLRSEFGKVAWIDKIEPDRGAHRARVTQTAIDAMCANMDSYTDDQIQRIQDSLEKRSEKSEDQDVPVWESARAIIP